MPLRLLRRPVPRARDRDNEPFTDERRLYDINPQIPTHRWALNGIVFRGDDTTLQK